jgi:hypothetical protein
VQELKTPSATGPLGNLIFQSCRLLLTVRCHAQAKWTVRLNSERETTSEERFDGERLVIDGRHFEDCHFETCTLVYRGGLPPNFVRCDFAAPRFVFEEAAQSTLQLMSAPTNERDLQRHRRTDHRKDLR